MPPFTQSVDGCLQASIGASGLSQASLDANLAELEARLASLRGAHQSGTLPLLLVPARRDDIAPAQDAIDRLSEGATTLVFFGTGGSSLGGQTLAQLGGWCIPGDNGNGGDRPRRRFYDNLDPRTLERALAGLDPGTTRFILTSKSGNTPETLVQAIAAIQIFHAAGLKDRIARSFLGLTEPASPGVSNCLRALCEALSIPMLPHDPGIGGRYSGLTNVGLLPALAHGLDVIALREGAENVVQSLLNAKQAANFSAAIGASVAIGLAKEKGIKANVMMPYADRLSRFAAWYAQLWGESLGKNGEGTTPVAALCPVDPTQPVAALSRWQPTTFHHHHSRELRWEGPQSFPRSRETCGRDLSRQSHRRRPHRRASSRHTRYLGRGGASRPHHRSRAAG